MENCFEGIPPFGFGFMRLPMNGKDVDIEETKKMVDAFLQEGFTYFDTAHGYIEGKSEIAIKECLTSRYPRDRYMLTNKLSGNFFEKEEDIRPLFQSQLEICGVDYFDFYLMHAQSCENYSKYKECRAYETAFELKAEGKIRHVGISFHDNAVFLDKILTENPGIEVVQLQVNYLDYEDAAIQSKACLEVAKKHGKAVIVMEPVKGGALVNLPEEAKTIFNQLGAASPASYALRFAATREGVAMTLSGMSNIEQVIDNTSIMKDIVPLDCAEKEAISKVVEIFHSKNLIACTACRYCVAGCPKHILIPDLFACRNAKELFGGGAFYYMRYTKENNKASDCIKCGKCENICPQHLPIREILKETAAVFEA